MGFEVTNLSNDSSPDSKPPVWAMIVVGLVLLAAVVGYFFR